jgi:hypothetical protein
MPAPGFATLDGDPVIDTTGNLAFTREFDSRPSSDVAVSLESAGTPVAIATSGQAAPGVEGADYSDLSIPVANSSGRVAFRAFLQGTSVLSNDHESLWSNASGLTLVARKDDAASGPVGTVPPGPFSVSC